MTKNINAKNKSKTSQEHHQNNSIDVNSFSLSCHSPSNTRGAGVVSQLSLWRQPTDRSLTVDARVAKLVRVAVQEYHERQRLGGVDAIRQEQARGDVRAERERHTAMPRETASATHETRGFPTGCLKRVRIAT